MIAAISLSFIVIFFRLLSHLNICRPAKISQFSILNVVVYS